MSQTPERKSPYPTLKLSKRMVARAQLDEAIELVFEHSNPVAANTLAWAAVDVLEAMAKSTGIEGFYKEIEIGIKDEYRSEWYSHLKRGYNFSKHADRDPEDDFEDFRPEAVTWTLLGGCLNYSRLFGQKSWPMVVFQIWFNCRNPSVTADELREMNSTMEPHLGFPKDRSFEGSTKEALEMLDGGKKYPSMVVELLGKNWAGTVEFDPIFE